jgi:hypothetical protein
MQKSLQNVKQSTATKARRSHHPRSPLSAAFLVHSETGMHDHKQELKEALSSINRQQNDRERVISLQVTEILVQDQF